MKQDEDEPLAFPEGINGGGMTLRDYFAGQALITTLYGQDRSDEQRVGRAYRIADLMLKEREKATAG